MLRSLIALGATALIVACGGAASPASNSGSDAATAAPAAGGATTTNAPAASPALSPSLTELLAGRKATAYKVTYKMSGVGADGSQQTWYLKGASSRFDMVTPQGAISMFALVEGVYMCSKDGSQTACFELPGGQGVGQQSPGAALDLRIQEQPGSFGATFEGTRSLAGESAQCFAAKDAASEYRLCYSSSGIPLLIESKAGGQAWGMEATSFTTNVSDADFKLPAPAQKLGY